MLLFITIMQNSLIFYQLYQIDAGSISTTCVHFDLKYLLHFLSIFTPNLLHFKNLLRYFAVFYDTFSLKKTSANLGFKRTFQYFQALYSVVRISSQLFHYNIDNLLRNVDLLDHISCQLISNCFFTCCKCFFF